MEVLQCDGCDFRAESYDDLKTHIQEVHTVFLQPADADESDSVKGDDEDDEDEEEFDDEDDKDYTPSKSGASPVTTDVSNQTSQKPTAESLLPFFQCKFCVRYFRSKAFLRNHTKKVHNIAEDSDARLKQPCYTVIMHNDNLKVYCCQYCAYKSPRKARIVKHQLMYHNKAPSVHEGDPKEYAETEEEQDSVDGLLKGQFACEWCDYLTDQKHSWTNHVVKEHSDKVKIVSCTEELEGAGQETSPKPQPQSSPRSPTRSNDNVGDGHKSEKSAGETPVLTSGKPANLSSFQYAQISAATPNSTGSSILSKKFASSDVAKSATDTDSNFINEDDSRSSLEDDDDEDLGDMDDPNYTGTLSADAKQLLSAEDNILLETKGIPFRKYMNRFQCPFCSFLTMHRRSISRHIENIHLSGKTTVYKCDECPFICTSSVKLVSHKQTHSSTNLETLDLTSDSPEPQNDNTSDSVNGDIPSSKVNGRKVASTPKDQQNPHRCTLCNFSTTTLKGLRVHQQHKHSYCDDLNTTTFDSQLTDQGDSEVDTSPILLQKTQTSILGLATKKTLLTGKRARKSINDLPLDLSSVKKRTRIDEIASNLQSKISQSQQDVIINLDDMDDEDTGENQNDISKIPIFTYNTLHLTDSQEGGRIGKRKSNPKSKRRSIPISLTLSDDSENISAEPTDGRDMIQDNAEYSEEPGTTRFYCKHCDYHNKSARSVSTHYQRMHPYIKFSFKYILDPEDQSAVFRCLECYIEYTNYNDLHQHYMDHHPEASNVLNFNQPNLVYMCRFCSYTSPNVRSLMPHYQRMHPTVKINNAMIFSSYVVEQSHKSNESQTLREILNSAPKNLNSSTPKSSSSPVLKSGSKTPDTTGDSEAMKEAVSGNVVVYDCDMCSFSSPNMHSVLVHYQKKHPEEKASYFRIQKTMKVVSLDGSQSGSNSTFNLSLATPPKSSNVAMYGADDEMYYCKHCVYSNRSVVGVLVHYQKRHPEVKVTAKYIKHGSPTPGLMKLMDELQIATPKQFLKQFQNNGCDASRNSSPKTGDKGEDELFFCQHCDYGNRTVKGVLIHYQKKHRDTKANADLVRRHTAVVRSQRERAQMVQSGSVSSAVTSGTTEPENPTTLRSLKCRHCSHTSPYVYALKKHLKKEHPTVKATAMTILHWAYQDGILEAGYHCEWCIYSHAEPQGLLLHYQRRHPEHNVDYAYMASKLWAGPETTQGGNLETKHYKCKDCAFEACSIWDITNHYQAVHPWVIKEDESVLLDIIKDKGSPENSNKVDDACFSFQTNEDDRATGIATPPQESNSHSTHPRLSISSNPYQCTVCLSEYNSLHGLLTHYGKKHPGMKVKAADFAQEADINPSSVYKCRHCPYVNSRIHGVLTHYQKRHPLVKVTAEDFADDIEHIADVNEDEKCKTQRQGYGAYRCKMCPYTHGTLEKLKIHYEKYHNQPASDMFTPSLVTFAAAKEAEPVAECSVSNLSKATEVQLGELDRALSQLPINKSEKHAVFKCQLCKYFCSTRKGIARHYRIKHNNVRAQPEGKNNVFKCALCSYTNPIRKGLAAHYQKRHDIDAYYTHCLAASKTINEKPLHKVMPTPPPDMESTEMSEELRLAVESRKCSLCAFQTFSRKSIVSHYIKRHPGVFPKKQHASKLGRYFTVIYAKEPEKTDPSEMEEDDKKALEVHLNTEQDGDGDGDWLPFKCLKCFRLSFSTVDLLSMHYNDHHGSDLKRDFVVMASQEEDDDSEFYHCSYCELQFLALPALAKHLMNHNEEFQKRAMRQERRRQLLSKHKAAEVPETKSEKEIPANKAPIGFRCNFCVEVHPTLRAICNHLRKHVQYGEVKEGHVKQEVSEVPLTPPSVSLTNGELEEDEPAGTEVEDLERPVDIPMGVDMVPVDSDCGSVAMEALNIQSNGSEGRAAALIAAARAVVSGGQLKPRLVAGGHPCAQCDRVFMSMQGLRSHERSHSAMALFSREDKYSCQYCQFVSPFRHNLDRHVQSHHGHHKPFKCKLCPFKSAYVSRLKSHLHKAHTGEHTYKCLSCPFSSMTISQLKEHSLRDHGEVLTLPKLRAATQAAHATLRPSRILLSTEQTSLNPDAYLEPADVRQQLSHYELASRGQISGCSPGGPVAVDNRQDGILTCEFCEFSSGYMQSLRRHYRDRHGGKKLFKCKDCSFFTCQKNAFNMHVESGHNNSPPEEIHKDLRCPLCLYHTKHKSNMIDHIVLHREERVAPLEVSRSKLSRHLQGLVFRCHKCTFTCSNDQALQQHLQKHAEIKPYQCQLCYYDTSRRSQLEDHLRLEHKVIRNFELMGRVSLDQLEMLHDHGSDEEEEEERELIAMESDGKMSAQDEDEGMEIMENDAQERQEMDDEEMERVFKEEAGVEDEEEELNGREEGEAEKPVAQDILTSPSSSSSGGSSMNGNVPGHSGVETRLPCEFCGRCFTNSFDWERHVLRHGMMMNSNGVDGGNSTGMEASAPPSIGSSSNCTESASPTTLLQSSQSQCAEDKELFETKKDQQFI